MRSLAFGFKDVIFRYKKEKEFIDVLIKKRRSGQWSPNGLENRRSGNWVASSNLVSSAKVAFDLNVGITARLICLSNFLRVRLLILPHGVMVTTFGFGPEVPSSSLGGATYIPL